VQGLEIDVLPHASVCDDNKIPLRRFSIQRISPHGRRESAVMLSLVMAAGIF
jgi:hypothetical protein